MEAVARHTERSGVSTLISRTRICLDIFRNSMVMPNWNGSRQISGTHLLGYRPHGSRFRSSGVPCWEGPSSIDMKWVRMMLSLLRSKHRKIQNKCIFPVSIPSIPFFLLTSHTEKRRHSGRCGLQPRTVRSVRHDVCASNWIRVQRIGVYLF